MAPFKLLSRKTFDVRNAILSMGAVSYVRISPAEGFYVFKYSGSRLVYGQDLGEVHKFWDVERWDVLCREKGHPRNACFIYHNDKLIYRESTHAVISKKELAKAGYEKAIKGLIKKGQVKDISPTHVEVLRAKEDLDWPDDVDEEFETLIDISPRCVVDDVYLSKYEKQINEARPIPLDMFTAEIMEGEEYSQIDYLIPPDEAKFSVLPNWKEVKKLLMDFSLLKEKRGVEKSVDANTKKLRAFILRQFKLLKKKKPLPLKRLKSKLEEEVNRRFSDNAEEADKYNWSEMTIRRVIENYMKK